MATNFKPESYTTITPYLSVAGAAELISFLERTFDANCTERIEEGGTIMHAEVRIGDGMVMVADACDKMPANLSGLYVYVPDVDATWQRAIDAGATPEKQPADQFYGDRSGGFIDKWGNHWWVATHVEDVSPEEMQRRTAEWQSKADAQAAQ
jgi:uncharacterized glyoxalase superfamily protein PhnB